ncbi:hypothetical protein BGZ67_008888 [Mortierella alpina]|nr:hypothetical protein BGZ67_008888 [Mortierella alpina]
MLNHTPTPAANPLCPLRLPEIIVHIGLFLARSDRVHALLVNRTWHSAIQPLLWTSVQLPTSWTVQKLPQRCPSAETVRRSCHFIRHLVFSDSPLLHELIPGCNQLRELELSILRRGVVPLLLQNAHTLRVLSRLASVHQPQRNVARDWDFFAAIASLERLEDLRLERLAIHEEESEAFIKTCSQIHSLHLVSCVWALPPLSDHQSIPADFTNIQQLTMIKNKHTPLQELQFASRCSNVRFLQWKTTGRLIEAQHPLVQELLQDRFLHLRTLAIASSSLDDIDIAVIIKGLSALVNLHASNSRLGPESVHAIVEHRSNLQELDIRNCSVGESLSQVILAHCPDLQTFGCDLYDLRTLQQGPWVCKRLQKLHITIVDFDVWRGPEGIVMEDRIRIHTEMFSQLAELTELTTLELGGVNPMWIGLYEEVYAQDLDGATPLPRSAKHELQLTLAMGFGKLESLKKLDHFATGRMYKEGLGREELVWAAKHWPCVEILQL